MMISPRLMRVDVDDVFIQDASARQCAVYAQRAKRVLNA